MANIDTLSTIISKTYPDLADNIANASTNPEFVKHINDLNQYEAMKVGRDLNKIAGTDAGKQQIANVLDQASQSGYDMAQLSPKQIIKTIEAASTEVVTPTETVEAKATIPTKTAEAEVETVTPTETIEVEAEVETVTPTETVEVEAEVETANTTTNDEPSGNAITDIQDTIKKMGTAEFVENIIAADEKTAGLADVLKEHDGVASALKTAIENNATFAQEVFELSNKDPKAEGITIDKITKSLGRRGPIGEDVRKTMEGALLTIAQNDGLSISHIEKVAEDLKDKHGLTLAKAAHMMQSDPDNFIASYLPGLADSEYGQALIEMIREFLPQLGEFLDPNFGPMAQFKNNFGHAVSVKSNAYKQRVAEANKPDIEVAKDAETQEVVASVGKDLTDQIDNNFNVFEIRVIENVLHNNVTAHLGDQWKKARETGGIVDQVELSKMKRYVAGETQAIDSTTLSNQFAQYAEERLATLDRTTPAGQAEAKALEKMNITPHQAQIIRDRAVNSIERLEPAFAQAASPVQLDQQPTPDIAPQPAANIDTTQVGDTGLQHLTSTAPALAPTGT